MNKEQQKTHLRKDSSGGTKDIQYFYQPNLRTRFYCCYKTKRVTVIPIKRESDVIFCLQLFSKTLICTLHWS